jgi:hypothetical protein
MKKISFTILDDYVSTEFLEQFGINADHEIIRVIEPILATDLDLDNESVYSFIENLRFDILGDLNSEIQCLGYEEEEWEDGFGREFGCHVFEDIPFKETQLWCIQKIRQEAKSRIDFRTLRKTLNIT